MSVQRPDFNLFISGAYQFLVDLNGAAEDGTGIPDALVELATDRDARYSTSTLASYTAYNPAWRVDIGELDAIEDLAPIMRLDIADWPHDEFDQSTDNYRQYWRMEMGIGIAVISREGDRQDAIARYFDACSVLVDRWMGSGSYLGMDRTNTGIERSSLTGGHWSASERNDQWLCSGFMQLRIRCRFKQSTI